MSEKRFTIVGEEYVGYTQGNAYIISNGECKFSLWESKEDAQKVCDYLNEQQATISRLNDENEQLRQTTKTQQIRIYCQDKEIQKLNEQLNKIPNTIKEVWLE